MSEETKKTAPAAEAEQQPAAAPEATAEQAAPAQEPAAEEAADPKDDKKKDGGWFNKKAREMEAVKAKLDVAEQNAAQAKEQLLRMAAEYDNYRKRSTREADQKFGDSVSHAVEKIIPILDTLDMAANAPTTDENYKKGVVMTLDKAAKALDALHVEEIEVLGGVSVTVDAPGRREKPRRKPLFRRAVTTDGARLGAVVGARVDAATFQVTSLTVSTGYWDDLLSGRLDVRHFAVTERGEVVADLQAREEDEHGWWKSVDAADVVYWRGRYRGHGRAGGAALCGQGAARATAGRTGRGEPGVPLRALLPLHRGVPREGDRGCLS